MIKQTFNMVILNKSWKSFKQTKKNQENSDNLLCENNKITTTLYNNLIKSLK